MLKKHKLNMRNGWSLIAEEGFAVCAMIERVKIGASLDVPNYNTQTSTTLQTKWTKIYVF